MNATYMIASTVAAVIAIIAGVSVMLRALRRRWQAEDNQTSALRDLTVAVRALSGQLQSLDRRFTKFEMRLNRVENRRTT